MPLATPRRASSAPGAAGRPCRVRGTRADRDRSMALEHQLRHRVLPDFFPGSRSAALLGCVPRWHCLTDLTIGAAAWRGRSADQSFLRVSNVMRGLTRVLSLRSSATDMVSDRAGERRLLEAQKCLPDHHPPSWCSLPTQRASPPPPHLPCLNTSCGWAPGRPRRDRTLTSLPQRGFTGCASEALKPGDACRRCKPRGAAPPLPRRRWGWERRLRKGYLGPWTRRPSAPRGCS